MDEYTKSGTENEGIDHHVPEKFLCPLTMDIFTDPLMSRRGLSYERNAILEWLDRGNETCPLTREPLEYKGLVPNYRLRLELEEWKAKNGYTITRCDAEVKKNRRFLCVIDAAPSTVRHNLWYDGNQDDRQQTDSSSQVFAPNQRQSGLPHFQRGDRSTRLTRQHQRRRFITTIGKALKTFRRIPISNN